MTLAAGFRPGEGGGAFGFGFAGLGTTSHSPIQKSNCRCSGAAQSNGFGGGVAGAAGC